MPMILIALAINTGFIVVISIFLDREWRINNKGITLGSRNIQFGSQTIGSMLSLVLKAISPFCSAN
jgi:hypothetical protein